MAAGARAIRTGAVLLYSWNWYGTIKVPANNNRAWLQNYASRSRSTNTALHPAIPTHHELFFDIFHGHETRCDWMASWWKYKLCIAAT
eukprot:scaffold823_cov219-Amphora_coffeaeformis.AAC.13